MIFLGNGEHSMADCYRLHLELERAFDILGGIQQPPHSPNEEVARLAEAEYLEGEQEVERIAANIYEALTGRRPQ